jgi:molybdopterin-guanine dinucleotide biosynthesis protein
MAVVVVGGHTRNIGKTGVVCGVIAALREMRWTAVKITQFGHGVCSANGEPCDCATTEHTIAVSEERNAESGKDTARYLQAGAVRSVWVRTQQGELHEAMPRVRRVIADAGNAVVESNSVLRFLRPDVALFVVDGRVADFKASALRYLDRVDALVAVGVAANVREEWEGVASSLLKGKPRFAVEEGTFMSAELAEFLRGRLKSGLEARAS